jgi:NADH dehydrogenase
MARRVLLTGAAGFVGGHVRRALVARGWQVQALVRRAGSLHDAGAGVSELVGDLADAAALGRAATGCDAVVHLVGIIAEKGTQTFERVHVAGTRQVVAAAQQAGVRRYVQMSALGTRPAANARYHQSKWAAEEIVRQSGLAFTIFRPSLIHGPDGAFTCMLRGWALGQAPPYLFMPYFGRGLWGMHSALLQPVFVEDVATVCAAALDTPAAAGQTYDVAGPTVYTWPQFLHIASRIFRGRAKPALGIPGWQAKLLTALRLPVPFTRDQVLMALEDNVGDTGPLGRDFGVALRDVAPTMTDYKDRMR